MTHVWVATAVYQGDDYDCPLIAVATSAAVADTEIERLISAVSQEWCVDPDQWIATNASLRHILEV